MSDYENCKVEIWSVTYYLKDENGDILNEDGSVKLFRDYNGSADTSTWAEWVEPETLDEVEDEKSELANLRELIQDDITTYFGGYENNIPFTYTNEQHDTFVDDICEIVVSKVNDLIEKQSG